MVSRRPVPESYLDHRLMDSVYFGPLKVQPGTVFLLGDNRPDSVDSRRFGAVAVDAVVGFVRARVWPPGDATWW